MQRYINGRTIARDVRWSRKRRWAKQTAVKSAVASRNSKIGSGCEEITIKEEEQRDAELVPSRDANGHLS